MGQRGREPQQMQVGSNRGQNNQIAMYECHLSGLKWIASAVLPGENLMGCAKNRFHVPAAAGPLLIV